MYLSTEITSRPLDFDISEAFESIPGLREEVEAISQELGDIDIDWLLEIHALGYDQYSPSNRILSLIDDPLLLSKFGNLAVKLDHIENLMILSDGEQRNNFLYFNDFGPLTDALECLSIESTERNPYQQFMASKLENALTNGILKGEEALINDPSTLKATLTDKIDQQIGSLEFDLGKLPEDLEETLEEIEKVKLIIAELNEVPLQKRNPVVHEIFREKLQILLEDEEYIRKQIDENHAPDIAACQALLARLSNLAL